MGVKAGITEISGLGSNIDNCGKREQMREEMGRGFSFGSNYNCDFKRRKSLVAAEELGSY